MLKQRVLTAGVLLSIMLAALLWLPTQGFAVVLGTVVLLGAREWAALIGYEPAGQQGYVGVLFLALLLLAWSQPTVPTLRPVVIGVATLFWVAVTVWLWRHAHVMGKPLNRTLLTVCGILVLTAPWLALVALHEQSGPWLVLFLLLIVWVADSCAYFAGRRWGRRRLAPALSPGKTIEGVYGGLFGVALLAVAGSIGVGLGVGQGLLFVGLCLLAAVVSIAGDLFESLLKRQCGVKDSGHLLPGHGGVLDRVDSLTAAAPLFVLGWWLLQGMAPA